MTRVLLIVALVLIAGTLTYLVTKPSGTGYRTGETIPDLAGVENVIVFGKGVLSGSQPEGEAGYDSLEVLGVRSVVSVDAARPDLERAQARGMRSVHIPLRYDGITGAQQLAIAKAIRDLPRPIYVHCHHGQHRGPAAAALGLVCLSELDAPEGVDLMRTAGTSEHYAALYEVVALAVPIEDATIDTLGPAELPEAVEVSGLAATMVEIGDVFGEISAIADAGWVTPADHPDIELEHAAPRLPDLFRVLADDLDRPENAHVDAGYRAAMREAAETAASLETAISAEDWTLAEALHTAAADSCMRCHESYR